MIGVSINKTEYFVKSGTKLKDLLLKVGFDFICGGNGTCGKCKVKILGLDYPITDREREVLSKKELDEGIRLACKVVLTSNCSVFFDTDSSVFVQTKGKSGDFILNPRFSKLGFALDIGTTTIVLRVYNNCGKMLGEISDINPERTYGADVMSRLKSSVDGKSIEIRECIIKKIKELLYKLSLSSSFSLDNIEAGVITGNTAMLYILLGEDVEPLTHAPFEIKEKFNKTIKAKDIGDLGIDKNALIYIPPVISAFIGADTVTACIASKMFEDNFSAVMVDIGTNGETVLRHNGSYYACSTAAGPAFEGGNITFGMTGSVGAIEHVCLENGNLSCKVIGNVLPIGICGSGIIDAVSCLLDKGEILGSGKTKEKILPLTNNVYVSQQDVRQVQLAKSAIVSGIYVLLKENNLSVLDLEKLYIAGGFGSYLDIRNAGKIGLIPNNAIDKVEVVGNSALEGAVMLLLNKEIINKYLDKINGIKVLELSGNPDFFELYTDNMMFINE